MMERIVCLTGPTAVGKTAAALALAERLGAEIVSADSRQVYRGLDIGTAKPTAEERLRVPHHVLDVVEPNEPYSAGRYRRDASACIEALWARGVRPLIVGGTGLYLRALFRGLCEGPPADPGIREEWTAREREAPGSVYRRLGDIDPVSAAAIHPHDLSKALRAVEVFTVTGTPLSVLQREHRFRVPQYDVVWIGLRRDRADLARRIAERVHAMMANGWADEVAALMRRGVRPGDPGLGAVGYRRMAETVAAGGDPARVIDDIIHETRRYAKRQMTWFRAEPDCRWIDLAPDADPSDTLSHITAGLAQAAPVGSSRSSR